MIEKIKNVTNNVVNKKKKEKEIPVFKNNLLFQDLDKFFKEIYTYYYLGGYKYIKKQIILDIIIYLFTSHFIMFIFFGIDWTQLFNFNLTISNISIINNNTNLSSNITLNISNFTNMTDFNNTNLKNSNITNNNITNNNSIETIYELKNYISFSLFYRHKIFAIFLYLLFLHYLISYFYSCLFFLKKMRFIKSIYKNKFHLHTKDLERISFNNILSLLIDLQDKESYCRIKDTLTKYDIISRICRKDNYVTALSYFNLLNFKIFGLDLMSNFIYNGIKSNFLSLLFNENEAEINKNFYNKKFFKISMIIQIIFQIIKMPPEIILRITFFFIKKVDKFQSTVNIYKNRWNRTNLLKFKNYNELKHHFRKRITRSYSPTNKFLLCFGNKNLSVIFYTIKLIGGYLLLFFFIIILFIGPNVFQMKIYNKNIISVSLILLIIIGLINYLNHGEGTGADIIENLDEKNEHFKEITKYIENIPNDWETYRFYKNYKIIKNSYTNHIYHFCIELLSVLFQPILWIKLIKNYDEMVTFIKTFSTDLEGIGTVCSFSVLNIKEYMKVQEKIKDLYKNDNIQKNYMIKFLNSLIYFEKSFIYNDFYIENNIKNDMNKTKGIEIIIADEESSLLKGKKNEEDDNDDNDKDNDDDNDNNNINNKIIDIIADKIMKNDKGKKNIDDIKGNISYYINIGINKNFDEIIKILYDKKYSFVNV